MNSGICERKAPISRNAKPELSFWMNNSAEPSNLQIFEGLFFMSFIKHMILSQTNNNRPAGEKHVPTLAWALNASVDPNWTQRHDFWTRHTINTFHGAPLHLGIWMIRKHFDAILSALSFTGAIPPTFLDKFWEI